jgi:hypothetical protein
VAQASAEKRVQYEVAPLDLAPYRALRWQRLTLVEGGGGGDGAAAGSQALAVRSAGCQQGGSGWRLRCLRRVGCEVSFDKAATCIVFY